METNYVKVSFNAELNAVDGVYADFLGGKNFTVNLLTQPFQLEVVATTHNDGVKYRTVSFDLQDDKNLNQHEQLKFESILQVGGEDIVQHTWNIRVSPLSRKITIETQGIILKDVEVSRISYGLYLPNPSLYGLFDSGIAQMMGKAHACLGSDETLERAYFMGGGSAMDTMFSTSYIDSSHQNPEVVLISSANDDYKSAIQHVVFGNYPRKSKKLTSAWSKSCWAEAQPIKLLSGEKWNTKVDLIPNNYNFPAYLLSNIDDSLNNMPFEYLQPYLTGIYGSPVGCIQSYYENQKGIIAPTISHPDIGYDPDTNFFDPDNFISLSAMLYSGDSYLMNQVKTILERTAETMCGIGNNQDKKYCGLDRQRLNHKPHLSSRFVRLSTTDNLNFNASSRAGQLMHHFISLAPTYESIAGSEQLGPNIFWTWSVLRYIGLSQDYVWAQKMFPFIDLSTKFMLSFVDSNKDYMINAPGPLWIDVVVRENYTSDSNAMMVPILQEISQFYEYLEVDPDFSQELREISLKIQGGINKYLWAASQDHLVTQLNLDGTSRDFVDYDSNLIAVAFGVIPDHQVQTVLDRVDNGSNTHVRATWCSELPYSGDANDCYIVGGNVCGDSVVSLARIGWVDALARKRVRDSKLVKEVLLQPLINDILESTWLYERYDANGNQIRTSFYFEYPSLIALIIREVVYGIDISMNYVNIDPIEYQPFQFNLGNTKVFFTKDEVILQLPSLGENGDVRKKDCHIHHLEKETSYSVKNSCDGSDRELQVDINGVLSFATTFGKSCEVRVSKIAIK
jgi:hypothetical protein